MIYSAEISKQNPFKYSKTSPEVIKLAIWYYIRFPLSLRNVEDILHERGIDICHETVRFWWNRFGPIFAKKLRSRRIRKHSLWRWHIDELFVKISARQHYLWRAIDHKGTVLECVVTKRRDRRAAFNKLKKLLSKYGTPHEIVTGKLRSYRAALREIGYSGTHETGQYKNNQCETSHLHFRRRERTWGKFRSMGSLQKFTSIQSQFHNHFQHQRHVDTRQTFKKLRNRSLGDWQNFCVVNKFRLI